MYNECFALIVEHIYGNPEILTTYQELVATQLATTLSIVTVVMPFVACLVICRMVFK